VNHSGKNDNQGHGSFCGLNSTNPTASTACPEQERFASQSLRRLQLKIGGQIASLFSWYRY
jgi:hypothetical protein